MGNSNSDLFTATTNENGEDIIKFDLFKEDPTIVINRDFSHDLVDYIHYNTNSNSITNSNEDGNADDKDYLISKYPNFKEQQTLYKALMDGFLQCEILALQYYDQALYRESEYREIFHEACSMNEFIKYSTGKDNSCLEGLFPKSMKMMSEKQVLEMHQDLLYCATSQGLSHDWSIYSSMKMRWSEPGYLIQLQPNVMSILKSKHFKPPQTPILESPPLLESETTPLLESSKLDSNNNCNNNCNNNSNIMSNYYYEKDDSEKMIEQKLVHIRNQIALHEYCTLKKCTSKTNNYRRDCYHEITNLHLMIGTALCKRDLLRCLSRNFSLHGNKLEDISFDDFNHCVFEESEASKCFREVERLCVL